MDDYLKLFDLVVMVARKRFQTAERRFAALGLNHTEARLLSLLRDAGGTAGQEILAAGLHIDRSNAGRALKRLEADGYIGRRRDPADKRAFQVEIMDKGMALTREIAGLKADMAHELLAALTPAEARQAGDLLAKTLAD